MDSSINIGNATTVNNIQGSMTVYNDAEGRRITTVEGVPRNPFETDAPLSASPPRQHVYPENQNGEAELPTSIQTRSMPSVDGERSSEMAQPGYGQLEEPGSPPRSPQFRTPVPVEGSSTDYVSAGREFNPGGLNAAGAAQDPTALLELKPTLPEGAAADMNRFSDSPRYMSLSEEESLSQPSADNTDVKRSYQNTGLPSPNDGDINNRPSDLHRPTYAAQQTANMDPSLTVDGPYSTPPNSSSSEGLRSVPLHDNTTRQIVQSPSNTSLPSSVSDIGDGASMSSVKNGGDGDSRNSPNTGEDERRSMAESLGSMEHPEQFGGQGEERSLGSLSQRSAPACLQVDGGGAGGVGEEGGGVEVGPEQELLVVLHRKMLIQDENVPYVSVVSTSPNLNVLEDGEKEGVLPGGPSQLVQMKWIGHRDFTLSQWKITLKPEEASSPDRSQTFIKHLCSLLQDFDIECLRSVMKQLKQQHSVYLHSLAWDRGLVVYLGHTNPDMRDTCMKMPVKVAVQSALQPLVSDCGLDLTWQDPELVEEEDTEDGRPPDLPEGESPARSAISLKLSTPDRINPARRFEDAQSSASASQQQTPSESGYSDQWSPSGSESRASSLMQIFQGLVEEKVSQLMERQPHLDRTENEEQLKQQLANLEHERKELEQTVQELRRDLDESQSANRAMSEKQEKAEKRQEEMLQLVNQVRTQLQEQTETIGEMRGAASIAESQRKEREMAEEKMKKEMKMMEENLRSMEERSLQHQQDQAKMQEVIDKKHRLLEEELSRCQEQLQAMQKETLRQRQRQGEHSAILTKHEELICLRMPQMGERSIIVGAERMGEEEEEREDEGAVGGEMGSRNMFSSALAESEETTSKMKGKDEEMGSNQMEEKIHPMASTALIADQMAALTGIPAREYHRPGTEQTLGVASAQGGARRKTSPKSAAQSDTETRGSSSPTPGRKTAIDRDSSQERTAALASPEEYMEGCAKAEDFLDWVRFSDGFSEAKSVMLKNVSAALKEEVVPAPRAKCLDTILCIDVSDSIVSEGLLDTVKKTAFTFVDGIEDQMNEMDLEENIAVVAMGGHARVVQHLTNDLTLVREAIESLDGSGGRSPFVQGLMVCLAANKERGGVVNIAGVHKLRPRIIFITDGCPTDEAQETGHDFPGNINAVKFSLVHFLSQYSSRKRRTSPWPISWVPVGRKADQKFLKSLAALTGGELVIPEEITSLSYYNKLQQTIGRLLKVMKNQDEDFVQEDKIRELLKAISSGTLTPAQKDHIVESVQRLQKYSETEDEPEADDFHAVIEDEVKVKNGELLSLGTRVVRGPHWKWKNQDTDGPGTVIQHSRKDNWLYVRWDNGTHNAYRYGEGGKTDVVETQHHPRQIPLDSDRLEYGVRVVRGPDWKRENEDGRGQGTVIRIRESDGKVKVRWDITGKICDYHHSKTKGREVQVCLPEFPRSAHSTGQDQNMEQRVDSPEKTIPMWKWRDERRQWRLYDRDVSNKLETEYVKRPSASCVIRRNGKDRRVSFKLMHEKTVDGGSHTEVMREMVDEERKNDLLAIEMSLQD
ncbi:uncharacterized protein LOC143282123 [Babylonia areolata]|uniref:uncharacterized protein LOC143282123 n=1 Tax=Babylonia areolata TaxID=304850 RepID=UPI003FD1A53D